MVSHLLCIFLLFLGFSCLNYACANAELRALMEIKASLDPENRLLSSWTSDGDPCSGSFEGVVCNEHHKVGNISLPAKGLTGKLSPALAELKCMSGLYLHYNNLNGEIPRELGNLTELTELYLDFNNLTGSIPHEIGKMASLQGENVLFFQFLAFTSSFQYQFNDKFHSICLVYVQIFLLNW